MLVDQMLSRIEFIHNRNFILRDVKPTHFSMGLGTNAHLVYIIDLSLAKRYIDPTTGLHIPFINRKSFTGTAGYASINTHFGNEQGRRDDIESLGYILVYFMQGKLPWQVKAKYNENLYDKIKEIKIKTSLDMIIYIIYYRK